jgi:hypothetical protein
MSTVALEIADDQLLAARDGAVTLKSPGVAVLGPAGLVVGSDAAATARLNPLLANDRYWSDLSTDPLPRGVPAGSTADLAYAHLSMAWQAAGGDGAEALLVVPGDWRPRELGLLLGIATAAGVPVAGMVDAGAAACAGVDAHASVLYLDVQRHQSVLTELAGSDDLRRRRVEVAPRAGLKVLWSAWAQLVSEAMVRRTRFDPLHQAASEQVLYDCLPGWLAALASAESMDAELTYAGVNHSVTLRREQFAHAADAYYTQLCDLVSAVRRSDEPATVVLSARTASLPGLRERLARFRDLDVVAVPEGAAALGALEHERECRDSGPSALLTRLVRARPARARPASRVAGREGPVPTHVVFAGRAFAIGAEPLVIGTEATGPRVISLPRDVAGASRSHCTLSLEDGTAVVRDHSRHGTWLNGERLAERAALAAGDRLRIGTPGVVLELVAVG